VAFFYRWVILTVFSPRSKFLHHRLVHSRIFCWALIFAIQLPAAGCFYKLHLGEVDGPPVDLKSFQPIALLPIQDFPGYPESGSLLVTPVQESLVKEGWSLIPPSQTSPVLEQFELRPQNLLTDPSSLMKVNGPLHAKIFLVGTILEYRVEKSFIRRQDFPIWDVWGGPGYGYWSLPTYHPGTCQIMLRLSLLDPEKGSVIWKAEGRISGPSSSRNDMAKKLVEGLLANFPSRLPQP
jgi:hypothetical protein